MSDKPPLINPALVKPDHPFNTRLAIPRRDSTPLKKLPGLQKLEAHEFAIMDHLAQAEVVLHSYKEAILKKGKYKGRRGRVEGMIFNSGQFYVLVNVFRLIRNPVRNAIKYIPSAEVLNSANNNSHTYWPLSDIELIPDMSTSNTRKE